MSIFKNEAKNPESFSNTIDHNESTKKVLNLNQNSVAKRNSGLLSELILIGLLFLIILTLFGCFYLLVIFFYEKLKNSSTKSKKRQNNSNEIQKNNKLLHRNTKIHKKRTIKR